MMRRSPRLLALPSGESSLSIYRETPVRIFRNRRGWKRGRASSVPTERGVVPAVVSSTMVPPSEPLESTMNSSSRRVRPCSTGYNPTVTQHTCSRKSVHNRTKPSSTHSAFFGFPHVFTILLLLVVLLAFALECIYLLIHVYLNSSIHLVDTRSDTLPYPCPHQNMHETKFFYVTLQKQMDTVQKEIEMLKQWKESKPQNLPVVVQRITKDLRDLRTEVNNVKEILDSRVSSGDFSRADRGSPLVDEMADYALQAQGGTIVTSRCSKTYDANAKVLNIMGIPLFKVTESPWTVIGGHPLQPGNCWPFQGSKGRLTVSLSHPVHVTHVSLEHIPAAVSPYGHIKSAPKEFAIYGMSTEQGEGSLLGTFTYDQAGDSLQMFEMPRLNNVYQFVELHVLQNWGDEDYTCLYRFHVHGKMTSD